MTGFFKISKDIAGIESNARIAINIIFKIVLMALIFKD
jgi:hypothetical protein